MDFLVFLNKLIIGFKPIKYTPFWWWYRLMSHEGFRFDDYHVWGEFWNSLNHGWLHVEYIYKFEEYWGKGSYPPERIVLPAEDFDALVERLNSPPDPAIVERFKELMNRKAPWDDDYESTN
jgi:hypothetical protein